MTPVVEACNPNPCYQGINSQQHILTQSLPLLDPTESFQPVPEAPSQSG